MRRPATYWTALARLAKERGDNVTLMVCLMAMDMFAAAGLKELVGEAKLPWRRSLP